MELTRHLLISARTDCLQALNVLGLIVIQKIPRNIEYLMHAYMLAKNWCEWITNPETADDSPLYGEKDDYELVLDTFEGYADILVDQLCEEEDLIEAYLGTLDPNFTSLWRGKNPELMENTRLLFRSLRYTAQMFEERFGDSHFNEILEEKNVPPMSELKRGRKLRRGIPGDAPPFAG